MLQHLSRGGLWLVVVALSICTLAACSAPRRGEPVPVALIDRAAIPGIPGARIPADVSTPEFETYIVNRAIAIRETLGMDATDAPPDASYLALSGGGSDGAYGAGILCAWTELGTRPQFRLVTGVSTGALTAPFAFLGPEYDDVLREVYTKTTDGDILRPRGKLRGLMSDAMADTAPLRALIAAKFGQVEMDRIAEEHAKGRDLCVATTDLDSGRPVIWDIGRIAASGHPDSLRLIRDVLLASASIPMVFPPVLFEVEVDGVRYQELHVDGGAAAQVFIYPPGLHLKELTDEHGLRANRTMYVIRNSQLAPPPERTERRSMAIASRSISSLIRTQGVGDLYRMYLQAIRDGIDFNVTYIPATFHLRPRSAFDPEYMLPLFQLGYERMKSGEVWDKYPPGFENVQIVPVGSD